MDIRQKIARMSNREIAIVMLIATLFLPTINTRGSGHHIANEIVRGVNIYALLWTIRLSYWIIYSQSGISIEGIEILNPYYMLGASIYSLFNMIFALQVIRFCRKKTSKRVALVTGIIGLIFPMIFMPSWMYQDALDFFWRSGLIIYYGPIPIQIIIGLIIMRYAGPWKVTKPWEDEEKSHEEWWKEEAETRTEEKR